MKRKVSIVMLFMALLSSVAMNAAGIAGTKYMGIGKVKGMPLDLFMQFTFNADKAILTLSGEKMDFNYKTSVVGKTTKVALSNGAGQSMGNYTISPDGGTMEGTFPVPGNPINMWLLKVPAELKDAEMSNEDLASTFGSKDGYTLLWVCDTSQGQMCITCDLEANASTKSYTLSTDITSVAKDVKQMEGTYRVEDGKIILTIKNGSTTKDVKLSVYDNGKYLVGDMGRMPQLGNVTWYLVR